VPLPIGGLAAGSGRTVVQDGAVIARRVNKIASGIQDHIQVDRALHHNRHYGVARFSLRTHVSELLDYRY